MLLCCAAAHQPDSASCRFASASAASSCRTASTELRWTFREQGRGTAPGGGGGRQEGKLSDRTTALTVSKGAMPVLKRLWLA
jgi:hypothetical protein